MDGLAESTLVTAYVLTTLSYLIIITRLFLRFYRHEKITVDDCLLIVALIFYTVFTATYPNSVGVPSSLPRTSTDFAIQVRNGTNVSFPDFSKLSLTSRTNNGTYSNGTEVSGGSNSSQLSPEFVARGTNHSPSTFDGYFSPLNSGARIQMGSVRPPVLLGVPLVYEILPCRPLPCCGHSRY
jgi:hypothetical protein